jgi:hypothetical protein
MSPREWDEVGGEVGKWDIEVGMEETHSVSTDGKQKEGKGKEGNDLWSIARR